MTDWSLIDDYFANRLPADERTRFESSLRTDTQLAQAVAFYVSTQRVVRQEARQQRRADLLTRPVGPSPARTAWPFALAAAACLALLLGIGWVLWSSPASPGELADDYINRNLTQLSVTMSAGTDSLQRGLDLANRGRLDEAAALLTDLINRQPTNADALQYAGIVALRRGRYDEALSRFEALARRTDLFANRGVFYQALTRLKRNGPSDQAQARALLQTVVNQNLDGASEARRLLAKL